MVFLVLPLAIGYFIRPKLPTVEKEAIYECGEPTIGSSYIQFDLRFYVVALLFIIFDVEVAFFFPWALIYGGSTQLMDPRLSEAGRTAISAKLLNVPATQSVQPITSHGGPSTGPAEPRRHPGLLRRASGRICLRLEAGRPRLGAGHLAEERLAY